MKIDRLIEAGVGRLEKLGFYAGLDTPLEGAEVHDVMDHLLTPPGWGVIPPTVEGEQLATINSVAKRYVASWMAEGADPRIAIQHLTIPNKEELLTEAILYWYGAASLRALAAYYHKHF